jgi:hypothetical protein
LETWLVLKNHLPKKFRFRFFAVLLLMRFSIQRYTHPGGPVTCRNCGHTFTGKICNECGEKVFHEKHLSTGHFFHQIVDFFTHFENKVLKTIWLNIKKPGFITRQNLNGIRVPYAKPVQLYLIVGLVFYFSVSAVHLNDYTPVMGDEQYYWVSNYPAFQWAKPIDHAVIDYIGGLEAQKLEQRSIQTQRNLIGNKPLQDIVLPGENGTDSTLITKKQLAAFINVQTGIDVQVKFNNKTSGYSKTLIFFIIPVIALLFYGIFYKRLKYYGSALLLATHFMVFNLCFYIVYHCLLGIGFRKLFGYDAGYIAGKPLNLLLEIPQLSSITGFLFGDGFEFPHLLFWGTWLFLAFRRLFEKPWWFNLLAAYLCSKVIFYLIFGVLKKFMIAFTLWMM